MSRGPLMIIGGAEDKLRGRAILKAFVAAAGGPDARIAVIPTASSLGPEIVEVYDALFRREGAGEVVAVRPESREAAGDPELVRRLDEATGVFMTGGNQLKLSATVCGTPVGDAIVAAHERGAVVAGTSAGASIQSSHMVAFGGPGSTPKQRMTQVAAGLGLLDASVIDQHFDQRNRYGRLLMITAQSPQLLGIGVDEDTAAIVETEPGDPEAAEAGEGVEAVEGRQVLRVLGKGAVTIFDPSRIVTNAYEAKRSATILASGVVLHVLPQGSAFDLTSRTLVPRETRVSAEDAAELAEAGNDLRKMARDIAADDVSPTTLRRRKARAARRTETRPAEQSSAEQRSEQA
ncbi:cyanophycinase [Nocardioides sp. CFH 31398]|uniref:cyanophycinase n=1 Tax=Nocardioides sp. CFH 31398 TaxID=2919579 RepID=UPI001F0695E7|nr:cyanophycinase [Nocardioides sp. CFH 31398]MCH1866781.1 cyanophycinase [Nocardioides sp. CFH 31398]